MSYNTSSIQFLSGALTITSRKARAFEKKADQSIGDLVKFAPENEDDDPKVRRILHIYSGECSLNHELPNFLALTEGEADLLVIWEGGDSVNGFRVTEGKVEEMGVQFVLVPVKKR